MPDWPHAPVHRLDHKGAYMVTAGTHRKEPHFRSRDRLELLAATLLETAEKHGWAMQAWAAFANHYHFIAIPSQTAESLPAFVREIHSRTAHELNRADGVSDRKVWFQYWDSHLTYLKSYYARLSYVHHNAVHHGLVRTPSAYPWCSAGWFEVKAPRSLRERILSLPIDRVNVRDDFELPADGWQ